MRDGKALQWRTSHELGQNFATRLRHHLHRRRTAAAELCWTTSWGVSTRMVGGVIMVHGDDTGCVLPPRLAPLQVVIVVVKDDAGVAEAVERLRRELEAAGDARPRRRPHRGRPRAPSSPTGSSRACPCGWRSARATSRPASSAWSGVTGAEREPVALDGAAAAATAALGAVQRALYEDAADLLARRTVDVDDVDAAVDAARDGFARLPWAFCGAEGERRLNAAGVSVRCLTTADGAIPDDLDAHDLVAIAGRAY